ncbi:hypothetical protein H4R19_003447 [Coemansia spiralis]|nr:hypothetical protein H4R19_003447 [Coemansia spiralis]
MVPTVGGSALVSVYRVLGTCAGGLVAYGVYEATHDTPLATYVLLVLFSVPCFHIMLHGRFPKIGQFALITFGVVLINKCIAREDQAESVGELAVRRTAAVALGVLAGMAATMYVWPFEARVRVRQALSWWLLTASRLYEQLWCTLWQSYAAPAHVAGDSTAIVVLDDDDDGQRPDTVRDYLDSELRLQGALLEIRALLSDTLNEPRLKGRFPMETYQRIINASQRVLDTMVAARWVLLPVSAAGASPLPAEERDQDAAAALRACALGSSEQPLLDTMMRASRAASGSTETLSPPPESRQSWVMDCAAATGNGVHVSWLIRRRVEQDLLRRTAAERTHRDALVSLTMYVLASALVLKSPLPAMMPPVEAAQQQVALAMRTVLDTPVEPDSGDAAHEHVVQAAVVRIKYAFYYSQVILGRQIVHELAIIVALMRELYGSTTH